MTYPKLTVAKVKMTLGIESMFGLSHAASKSKVRMDTLTFIIFGQLIETSTVVIATIVTMLAVSPLWTSLVMVAKSIQLLR